MKGLALERIRAYHKAGRPFDLVLMDWRMPGMDGIEAASRIKADSHLAKTPAVLMISALRRDDLAQQARQIGLDGFLLKPILKSALVKAINVVFGLAAPEASASQRQAAQSVSLAGKRVLLVEDNRFNREVAIDMLQGMQLDVDYARNGQEGVERLKKGNHYDLVLMDIQMPVMDGIEATRLLRADPRFAQLPIIAMTAHAMVEDRGKSLAAGMNDHITKPVNPQQLAAAMQRWLGPGEAPAALPPPVVSQAAGEEAMQLDLGKALQFADGDEKKMHERLRNFAVCYEAAPSRMEAMALHSNYDGLRQLAHTLKSASGYIGAMRLQLAAVRLLADKAPREPLAATLRQELQDVLATIASLAPLPTVGKAGPVVLPEELAEILGELESLIRSGDARASLQLAELEQGLAGTPLASGLAAIREAFDDLDLPLALKELAVCRQICAVASEAGL